MRVFKDVFTDDELACDTFPMKIVDDFVCQFKGTFVERHEGVIHVEGENPSSKGPGKPIEEHVDRGIDIALNHRMHRAAHYKDPEVFKEYMKEFEQKTIEYMKKEGKTDEEVDEFQKKCSQWVLNLCTPDRFKRLHFFIGENMADGKGEGQLAIFEYREEDGEKVPYLLLLKDAIAPEKE